MSKGDVIFETKDRKYRIIQEHDLDYDLDDLKGDCFKPDEVWVRMGCALLIEQRAQEEHEFEQRVLNEGVYGYVLEKWNAKPGKGYEHVDSCWGFIGAYCEGDKDCEHYIVEEMKETIKRGDK
jgi:hypothetical protein